MTMAENLKFSKNLRGKTSYDRYDNYDAIDVATYKEIPSDFDGVMGVPVTFLDKYNPDQFEILGITKTWFGAACKTFPNQIQIGKNGARSIVSKLNDQPAMRVKQPPTGQTYYVVNDKYYIALYQRILIRHRRQQRAKK
jgi:Adenine-specific methyltransferase EcoRI